MARRQYLITSAACAALAAALYLLVMNVALAQRVDVHVLAGALRHQTAGRVVVASDLVGLFDPMPFVLLAAAVVSGALVARRVRAAVAAALLLAGANLT